MVQKVCGGKIIAILMNHQKVSLINSSSSLNQIDEGHLINDVMQRGGDYGY